MFGSRYPYCATSPDSAVSEEFVSEELLESFKSLSEEFVSEEFRESSNSLSEEFVELLIEFDSFLYGNAAKVRSRKAKSKVKDCERHILELGICVILLLPAL